ncbi:unnamed protein product [Cladocopium goreaui]|uniref:Copia protein n=1 Tax=Cladocopium goreaui TaxID=2562237 RepID=A0A9P1FYY7_9DINO|nr:unnamed protein product [Cladocopium goreaui]
MPVDDEVGNDDNTAAGLPGLASDSPGLLSHGSPGLGASVGPEHTMDLGLSDPAPIGLEEPGPQQHPALPLDTSMDVPISVGEPSREPSPTQANRPTTSDMPPPSSIPSSSQPQLDSITASYYQPATAEDFRAHRRRLQQQETMSFGPFRSRRQASESAPPDSTHGEGPYTKPKEDDGASFVFSAFDVEDLDSSALPSGWKFENGYIQLTEQPKDYWEIKSGCLIRHHVVPRRTRFDPNKMSEKDKSHIPITLDKLDPTRETVCTGPNEVRHYHDVIGDLSSATNKPWVGCTIFQINGATRQELGMTAYSVNALFFVDFCTHDDRPQWTESMDVDEIYGSVDEKHLCEEQRLLDDAHVSVDEATFVETFVPQNVLHSDLYDVSDPMHSPENVLASAESLDPANDLVTENANTFVNAQAPAETFVPVNVKAPVESFARASNVARPCLKYVMALSLLAGCAGDPLWPMVDKHHDWRDQCALGENSSATAHTGFHWIWVIFLFNLVFSVCCFCAALLMRRRWLEMDRARLELYRQNEYFRAEIRKLRNEIIDVDWQRQDLQLKVLDHDRIRSEEREEDQRVVRKASGLLDRILVELEILTGTTFFEDCAAFFHQHGRWDYMQTVIE